MAGNYTVPNDAPGNGETYSLEDAECNPEDAEVDIIICVHNAFDHVVQCLRSVRKHTRTPYRVTVVDDASDPDLEQYLKDHERAHSNVTVLRNAANLGYTKSANLGLKNSTADWVVLLNSDTIVTSQWLDGLLACAARDSSIRAVGPLSNAATFQSVPLTREKGGNFIVNELPPQWTPEDMNRMVREHGTVEYFYVPILNGFCTLFHRPTIAALGYLDEHKFPVGYGEENDLCLRLTRNNYRLAVASRVYIYHSKSASFGHHARKKLTAEGIRALKAHWPGYNYHYISDRVSETPALKALRSRLTRRTRRTRRTGGPR